MIINQCLKLRRALSPLKLQNRHVSIYNRGMRFFFKKYLLLTNSLTSGAFLLAGDLIQQEFEFEYISKDLLDRYDWTRARRMFIVGCFLGPLHHFYYIYLDNILPHANVKTVMKKILCDQFICSPLTILCFFYGMGHLEGKSIQESSNEIKKKFQLVYMGDWLYWPPIQFVNFYYLPTRFRVFYINIATMIFNIFLSYTKHYDQH